MKGLDMGKESLDFLKKLRRRRKLLWKLITKVSCWAGTKHLCATTS